MGLALGRRGRVVFSRVLDPAGCTAHRLGPAPKKKKFLALKVKPQKTVLAFLKCEGSGSCLEILWLEPLFELFLALNTVGLEQ